MREGITYLSVHPVSWSEPTVLERRFDPGISPEEAAEVAKEFAHDDFAFVFEAFWDLWVPNEDEHGESGCKGRSPCASWFTACNSTKAFTPRTATSKCDFGLDTAFVYEEREISPFIEKHLRSNIAKLVAFSAAVEKNCGVSGRVLWSESEENLAQKLIAKLQQTQ